MPVLEDQAQNKTIVGIPNEMIQDPWFIMTHQD